jgi:lactate dehydrogenase-like 2-hydroxyacid dehydrogenase
VVVSGTFSVKLNVGTSVGELVIRVADLVNASVACIDVVTVQAADVTFRFVTNATTSSTSDNAVALADSLTQRFTGDSQQVEATLGVSGMSCPPLSTSPPSNGSKLGIIIGAVGGAVLLFVVAVGVVVLRSRRRHSSAHHEDFVTMNSQMADLALHLNADDYRETHV